MGYTEVDSKKNLEELTSFLANNNAVLMVGSGFSKNATRVDDYEGSFLDWSELSSLFYEKLYGDASSTVNKSNDPLRLAREVELEFGGEEVEKILHNAVPDDHYAPSDLHISLLELPWCDVFTTNYDTLLERATEKITTKRYDIITKQVDLIGNNNPRIIKLHGSFPEGKPFIITEEHYRKYPKEFAPFVNTVQQAMIENAFCLIGFSGDDPNFKKWMGWIRDNLGLSNTKRIYRIVIDGIDAIEKSINQKEGIHCIDLKDLWGEEDIYSRLNKLINYFRKEVNDKGSEKTWPNITIISDFKNKDIDETISFLKSYREKYPGWVFVPKEYRKKCDLLLSRINCSKIQKCLNGSTNKKNIELISEIVKIHDVIGRPLTYSFSNMFWNKLRKIKYEKCDCQEKRMVNCIFVQLLRSFREMGLWDKFKECKSLIDDDLLDYEDRQLLKEEKCRYYLSIVDNIKLRSEIFSWDFDANDLYWPLKKASFLALLGEFDSAIGILEKSLFKVRKELTIDNNSPYYASLEECMVSLINMIKQNDIEPFKGEKNVNSIRHSWDDTNEWFYLQMNIPIREYNNISEEIKFDLGIKYSWKFISNNDDIYLAMEYCRFLEKTGGHFKIGRVTNERGFDGVIQRLINYYDVWCVSLMIMYGEYKSIDAIFSRKNVTLMSVDETDHYIDHYINVFKSCIDEKHDNSIIPISFYDQAAKVIPLVLARLCYKGSSNKLDEILDLLYLVANKRKTWYFKDLNYLMKIIIEAYSTDEQIERIDKILDFPIVICNDNKYMDPILYLHIYHGKKKSANLYEKKLVEIREHVLKDNNKREALLRFLFLEMYIEISEKDLNIIKCELENTSELNDIYNLSCLDPNIDYSLIKYMIEKVIDDYKKQTTKSHYVARDDISKYLILLRNNIDFSKNDPLYSLKILKEYLEVSSQAFFKDEPLVRIMQDNAIVIGVLVIFDMFKMAKVSPNSNEIEEFFVASSKVCNIDVLKYMVSTVLGIVNSIDDLASTLKPYRKRELNLLYKVLFSLKERARIDDKLKILLDDLSNVIYAKIDIFETEKDIYFVKIFGALTALYFENNMEIKNVEPLLLFCAEKTVIKENDSEEIAIIKASIRKEACLIARNVGNYTDDMKAIKVWQKIAEDRNEMADVRNIFC